MRKASQSAALLVLCATAAAAALTGCGGPAREGYVALGAAAPGPERGAGDNVAPKGGVEYQPLPRAAAGSTASSEQSASGTSASTPGSQPPGGSTPGGAAATAPGGSGVRPGTAAGATPSTSPGGASGTPANPPSKPGTTAPVPPAATPAKLAVGAPVRGGAAERWCEQVTVDFTNTGGAPARSGTVSFATHIIGALGVDWATITSTQPLPAPIAGGTTKTQTYRVCVESWRVPLGMRVETRKVTATWS